MPTLSVAALIAGYVLLAVLLLSLNFHSHWPWQVKAGAVTLVSGFYIVTYYSFSPLLGWPAAAELPNRFQLLAVDIREPDKTTG